MKKSFFLVAAMVMTGSLTLVYAADVAKGKALFESSSLGQGSTGRSCKTCHAGGVGLSADIFNDNGKLVENINACIAKPLGGVAIDPEGQNMQDLIAYMKTLVMNPVK